jgi:hypothetical protein
VTEALPAGGPDQEPLPPLDPVQRLILPVADAFMILMLSRPQSGSLRTTRVTMVSMVLAGVAFVAFGLAGLFVAVGGHRILLVVAGTLLELFALGCLSLAIYGVLQRRHVGAGD